MNRPTDRLAVSTATDEHGVYQVRDVFGEVTQQYVILCAAHMDKAIREKLIELGWTPPVDEKPCPLPHARARVCDPDA
ncbi:hypothetical protein [Stenotrophomonas geniculata]|uniref:hypothetical protein n=1 Tax=Stenotrophomonas geniculata TaxID=86188 RepID=UPI0039C75E36